MITQQEVLELFTQVAAIKNSDHFLLIKANQNGTVSATKATAEVVRAYFNAGFEISVSNDGYLVIGGTKSEHRIAGITPVLRRGPNGIQSSTDGGETWEYIAYFSDLINENIVEQTADTVSIRPNVLNVWSQDKSLLTISFTTGAPNVVNEYMMQFQCGSTPTTLILPEQVRWIDDEPLECEADHIYQVSIVNNMAVGAGWPKP